MVSQEGLFLTSSYVSEFARLCGRLLGHRYAVLFGRQVYIISRQLGVGWRPPGIVPISQGRGLRGEGFGDR